MSDVTDEHTIDLRLFTKLLIARLIAIYSSWKVYSMFPPTRINCYYCCVTFVSLFINLSHPRDFTSHTSRMVQRNGLNFSPTKDGPVFSGQTLEFCARALWALAKNWRNRVLFVDFPPETAATLSRFGFVCMFGTPRTRNFQRDKKEKKTAPVGFGKGR